MAIIWIIKTFKINHQGQFFIQRAESSYEFSGLMLQNCNVDLLFDPGGVILFISAYPILHLFVFELFPYIVHSLNIF